jgi:phage FluMu protein Com
MTDDEKTFYEEKKCPNCNSEDCFVEGPSTAAARNIRCEKCNTYYILVPCIKYIQKFIPKLWNW